MAAYRCEWSTWLLAAAVIVSTLATTAKGLPSDFGFGPVACPGLFPQLVAGSYYLICTRPCQVATCTALAKLFNSTLNATTPYLNSWRNRKGWEAFLTKNCTEILGPPTAVGPPSYCSWHGVTCPTGPMQAEYRMVNTLVSIQIEVNGLNGSVSNPIFQDSIAQLHACGLISLELAGNALSGTLDESWGKLKNLRLLNLAKNMIQGTIPEALRHLSELIVLQLDRNLMHGTIPTWLSELKSLRWLGLSAFAGRDADGRQGLTGTIPLSLGNLTDLQLLTLDSNSLTGSFPPQLCHRDFYGIVLRSNQITWSLEDLKNCTDISFFDFHNNKYAGTLPNQDSAWNFTELLWLDLSSNGITGTLPSGLYQLGHVSILNLANNRLNGTIDSAISQMPYLMDVDLRGNNLTGTIDESVWYMARLKSIDLSGNKLSGTISPAIGLSYYLSTVLLDHNQLTGSIPEEVAILPALTTMDLSSNSLGCAGRGSHITDTDHCGPEDRLLPCFLNFTKYTIPRTYGSNMECPAIERKSRADIVSDCGGPAQLGDLVTSLPPDDKRVQDWHLDPNYYHYQGCKCLGGYFEVWDDGHTTLSCKAITSTLPPWLVPLSAVLFSVFVLFLAAVGLLVWLKLTVQLRRKWQREKELNNNRLKGVPNGGPAAIVVTDVEKYSELMQLNAALTTRAMGIHNAILRKAVATHAGHVIEQEGDSWSVAFHRSADAVAFCLQVQQALQKSHWPSELAELMSGKHAVARSSVSASAPSYSSYVTADAVQKQQGGTDPAKPQAATGGGSQPFDTLEDGRASRGPSVQSLGSRMTSFVQYLVGRNSAEGKVKQYVTDSDGTSMHGTAVVNVYYHSDETRKALPTQRHASIDSEAMTGRGSSVAYSSKGGAYAAKGKHMKTSSGNVLGLRVRMGITSGWVPADNDIKTSAVFALAKAVSDMANGGQILMESRTADAVRDWLSDLGCVDHKGYNDKLLSTSHNQAANGNTKGFARWLLSFLSCALRATISERDPVLLDMGQFWMPGLASTMKAVTTAIAESQVTSSLFQQFGARRRFTRSYSMNQVITEDDQGSSTNALVLQEGIKACVTLTTCALKYGQTIHGVNGADGIYLYSIVAQPLQARSQLWRNDLSTKDDFQQLAKGYFAAPGAVLAYVTSSGLVEVERPILPSVTMVFAAVEDGKQLVRKTEHVATIIHSVFSRIMQALLLSFPDGYLCREQEAVLKYMVAFREPARAAEWCLLVQDVLQYVPWPAEVMEALNSRGTHASRSTAGAKRSTPVGGIKRPGLKMGLAEGVPDSIAPDHLGRADYFGTSVNLAARIMDAAAHSGQVVMSSELAESIFSVWRYESELETATTVTCQGHSVGGWKAISLSGGAAVEPDLADSAGLKGQSLKQSAEDTACLQEVQHIQHKTEEQYAAKPEHHLTGSQDNPVMAASAARLPASLPGASHDTQWAKLSAVGSEQAMTRTVQVSAHHIGTYAFKGCGAMEMVCLTSDAVVGMTELQCAAPAKGAKGTLISAAKGPVIGMQDRTVAMPNILQEFQEAWSQVAHKIAAPSTIIST